MTKASRVEHRFGGRLVMLGFGCIGQGVLPLLLRHLDIQPSQILIVTRGASGLDVAREYGVPSLLLALTPGNFREALDPWVGAGDFVLNLAVDVGSVDVIAWCQQRGALYLDTCIEPWAGGYLDPALSSAMRTNYALRQAALALRRPGGPHPTAVLTHGANPGLVSHLLKQALLDLAGIASDAAGRPRSREQWARLAQRLGVKVIHIAERDTQLAAERKQPGEFVNTWSAEAFVDEGTQPAELGWGSHERHFPADGARHEAGSRAAIYLRRPGAGTRVRSWTPSLGPMHAFLITHTESISIADHFTLADASGRVLYRPTVHYAYLPCDDAVLSLHELAGREWRVQDRLRVLKADIRSGVDELGVLLMGPQRGATWYGSRLSIDETRVLAPHNSATSLQVTAAVMAGVVWAMRHPAEGIVEPDDLPFDELLALSRPYLGDLVAVTTDWTPLADRAWLFDEDLDRDDPWQFKNFRVS